MISNTISTSRPSLSPAWITRPFGPTCARYYAVTRCLEIISEASRRLPDEMKARYPAIAWKNMAGPATSTVMTTRMLPRSWYGTLLQLASPPLRDVVAREIDALE